MMQSMTHSEAKKHLTQDDCIALKACAEPSVETSDLPQLTKTESVCIH